MPPIISNERIGEYEKTVLQILHGNGGSLPSRQVTLEMEKRLQLSDYEKFVYSKTGYIRWQSIVHFYSINLAKAGWIKKEKGVWYITDEGTKILKLSSEEIFRISREKYAEWAATRTIPEPSVLTDESRVVSIPNYEQAQSNAREEIKEYVRKLNPYDIQDLVAALFRGMGYYTPFVAPRGPDGGIDVIAYKDPIGAELPRILIQVKHRPDSPVSRAEIAELDHALNREGYIGVIVSTGGFSRDAFNEMRTAHKHMEKIDLDHLIDLWEEHYEKVADEDKYRLPLKKVAYLAPEE